MGQRGRNRNGYYITLLHVLELLYQRESRLKGDDPAHWQPSPQNRPDQFLRWVLDVLDNLNFPPPRTLEEVIGQLETGRLNHVARLLEHAVSSHVGSSAWQVATTRPIATLLHEIDRPTRSLEKHPQVRKFSKVIVQQLDGDWKKALESTSREFRAIHDVPRSAFLLGGLPPSFPVLSDFILGRLTDCELVSQHRSLTVLQFYGLVTGTLPTPPVGWRRGIEELESLEEDEILLLASLSDTQVRQLRQLGEEGLYLLRVRLRLRVTPLQWSRLGETLVTGEEVRPRTAHRLASFLATSSAGRLEASRLKTLAASPAWQVVAEMDEELMRLIGRGELSNKLIQRIQGWDEETWAVTRELLLAERDACLAFIEDRRILRGLFESRTGAHLHLRELFPKTMAWLDEYLNLYLEDALLNDVGELETAAAIVSRRVQQKFWSGVTHRGVFDSAASSVDLARIRSGELRVPD